MARKTIAFVVYPGISLLELVGTRSMLGSIAGMGAGYDSVVVAEKNSRILTDTPMAIIPQKTFDEIPQPDALVVIGGGSETIPALENTRLLEYIGRVGEKAEMVVATSTGALFLASAGLLQGRKSTTHWAYADRLTALGSSYQRKSWVRDGKFTTSAGVSGGLDMAIALGAEMTSKENAQSAQLMIEYDPHPPFGNIDWSQGDPADRIAAWRTKPVASADSKQIAFFMYPDLTVFDLVGPLQVISALSRLDPRITPLVVAEHPGPIRTDIGIEMIPNCTLSDLPNPAGLVVPGGDISTLKAMSNPAIRRYIRHAVDDAEWVVSVCTGALILAAVGLLDGCEVTTHWAYRDFLPAFGARYVQKRWTHNGKIINSAGVSAGIDMAFYLAAQMSGPEFARTAQLAIQYDPQPPFGGIDYANLRFFPRLLRRVNSMRSIFYTVKPRQMIRQGI